MAGDDVHGAVVVVTVHPRADYPRGREAGDAAHRVDDDAAGEVVKAEVREEAAGPREADDDGVDDSRQQNRVGDVRAEFRAAGDGAGDDGRGGHGEDGSEEPVHPRPGRPLRGHVEVGERAEDVGTAAPGDAPDDGREGGPEEEVDRDPDGPRQEVLRQLVGDVLRAHLPGLQHGEAGVHEEDEEGDGEDPHHVHPLDDGREVGLQGCHVTIPPLGGAPGRLGRSFIGSVFRVDS